MENFPGRHPVPTNANAVLWRYMSVTKLFALLAGGQLFLCRCDKFEDPFDGSLGAEEHRDSVIGVLDVLGDELGRAWSEGATLKLKWPDSGTESSHEMPTWLREQMLQGLGSKEALLNRIRNDINSVFRTDLSKAYQSALERTFVSCWHTSDYESEAMWRLYAKDSTESIAIRTTASSLLKSIGSGFTGALFRVTYDNDYIHRAGDHPLYRFCVKRRSFEHESESRLIMQSENNAQGQAGGTHLDVDTNNLIETVLVSPYAAEWVKETVETVCRKLGLLAPVTSSELMKRAFHS